MTVTTQTVQPTMWLMEGYIEVKGNQYAFWFELDDRFQDQYTLEFTDQDPYDVHGFDYDALVEYCKARIELFKKGKGVSAHEVVNSPAQRKNETW